jgi:hypothetical protein
VQHQDTGNQKGRFQNAPQKDKKEGPHDGTLTGWKDNWLQNKNRTSR